MGWVWFAHVGERPSSADLCVAARHVDGSDGGFLAAWRPHAKPLREALRADERIFDPDGAAGVVSLVLAPRGVRLLFDDTAVAEARRRVLAAVPPADAVSTLLSDASHFEGAVSVWRGVPEWVPGADPFARVFPALRLEVEAGLFGRVPAPAGPVTERYGSAQPWPADRFG